MGNNDGMMYGLKWAHICKGKVATSAITNMRWFCKTCWDRQDTKCSNSKIYPFISRMPEHKVTDLQKPHLISTGSLRRARPGDKRSKSTYCQDSYSSGLSSLFEEWSSRTQAAWTKLLMVSKCKSGPYPNHLINIPFQLLSSPLVRGCV
jgi:hypothetical protein